MPSSTGRPAQAIESLRSLARRSGRRLAPLGMPSSICPAQSAEIDALLAAAATDNLEFAIRLSSRLQPLVQRGIPPRVIEAAPVPHAARLRFADGTAVVVRGVVPGDVGVLAVAMRRGSVKTAAHATSPEGKTRLLLTWPGARRGLWLYVLGLDQPD
ncbi:MAG TPA: hypothetical protein VED59_09730 [Acidimicrobiales bacterium]|nr:hypothetical protein [Acidimicrobiales bacterium]